MALAAAAVLLGVGALAFVSLGGVDVAASDPHSRPTYWLLHYAFNRSVSMRSSGIEPPADLKAPSRVALGAQQFHLECSNCHGGPGLGQSPVALSMTPRPQHLPAVVGQFTDPELFWIVKHGVKFSAMPSWPTQTRDDEVWSMVAFLRKLPTMTPQEYLGFVAPRPAVAGAPLVPLRAPFVSKDADTVRNTYPRDEFLYASPAVGFGDQGASVNPVEMCGRCHGDDGTGGATGGEAPNLTLQSADYLRRTLEAYANGERRSGFMTPIAAQLSADQIDALARYYSSLARVQTASATPVAYPRGEEIALRGVASAALPACAICHSGSAQERLHAPSLAGQQEVYLRRQLTAMRDHFRGDNGTWNPMPGVAHALSDGDIAAVAAYYARQPAGAAVPPAAAPADQGNAADAAALFGKVCATCHGRAAGGDREGDFPNLTVQTPAYLRLALEQYRAGIRTDAKMALAAKDLDDATIAALAHYVSGLPAGSAAPATFDAAAVERGAAIARDGIVRRGVPACLGCHDGELTQALPLVARLNGQNPLYLQRQLDAFAHMPWEEASRLNPMPEIARVLTREEQRDVAAYFASQPGLPKAD